MSAAKTRRGKRYSDAEKKRIVKFARDHDAANGRGGRSAAVRKFGVSALSLGTWMSGGADPKAPRGKARKADGKSKAAGGPKSLEGKLAELVELAGRIRAAESALDAKRVRFDRLKASL